MGERREAREAYERTVGELKRSGIPEARAVEVAQRAAHIHQADIKRERAEPLPPPSWAGDRERIRQQREAERKK